MRTIFIVAVILLTGRFRHAEAEVEEESESAVAFQRGRTVALGIYFLYDSNFVTLRNVPKVSIPPEEYLSLLLRMAEKTHFGNVTCTNISFVFLGASELNDSYGVEHFVSQGNMGIKGNLDIKATLPNLRTYASEHRKEFHNPDLTVLITGHYTTFSSEACMEMPPSDPLYKSTCSHGSGGSYFKGICGNESVAVVRDDTQKFYGATSLAEQITTLFGVTPDVLKNDSKCNKPNDYFTSGGWFLPLYLEYPGLSPCAVAEFTAFIDNMSVSGNACWEDIPTPSAFQTNLTTDNLSESVDMCKWYLSRGYKCTPVNKISGLDDVCTTYCCKGRETYHRFLVPPGKSCGASGVCFNGQCFNRTEEKHIS